MKKSTFVKTLLSSPLIVGLASVLFSLTISVNVKAATSSGSNNLPFYVNSSDIAIDGSDLYFLQNGLDNFNSGIDLYNDTVVIFKTSEQVWYTYNDLIYVPVFKIYKVDTDLAGQQIFLNNFSPAGTRYDNFLLFDNSYTVDGTISVLAYARVVPRTIGNNLYNGFDFQITNYSVGQSTTLNLFGDFSTTSVTSSYGTFEYNSHYPIYISKTFNTEYGSNLVPVLDNGHVVILPDLPDISELESEIINIYDPGSVTPGTVNPNQSNIDNLKDLLNNFLNNLNGWLNKIQNELEKATQNVLNGLASLGNYIISGLLNGLKYLTDWLSSFFGDWHKQQSEFHAQLIGKIDDLKETANNLYEFGSYLGEFFTDDNGDFNLAWGLFNLFVPDISDIANALKQTLFGSLVITIVSKISAFINLFNTMTNVQPVKVLNIPSFTFAGKTFSGLQIDFSWYDNYKTYGDGIISFFLIINYFHFLFLYAPKFFRSTGSGFDYDTKAIDKL